MSGITGLFRRTGEPVGCDDVQAMLATIDYRGPDGSGCWADGSVGLGHRMLWTTPESLKENLPRLDQRAGVAITCDARIDNRLELAEALGLRIPLNEITDSDLIVEAYRKWGEQCPSKLIGDFAFVIWDTRLQKLFCARDAMGIKCLYYFTSPTQFVFASEIKALLAVRDVPRRLNEMRVLDYLVNLFEDRSITFYKDIFRLPPASTLTVTRDKVRVERYWTLDPSRELKLGSDEEFAEAFRDCFVEAVRCRMRSAFPIGSALSGGLDSSAIACTVDQLRRQGGQEAPLDTFSLIFPDLPKEDLRHIDERPFINSVLKSGNFHPHFIEADKLSPLKNVADIHSHLDEAFFAGNLYLHWAMYSRAKESGVRIFLDGLDGDTTVSHGFEGLADLIVTLRWKTLFREIKLIRQNLHLGRKRIIGDFCIAPLCPSWVYKLAYAFRGRVDDNRVTAGLVSEEFKERLQLKDRVDSLMVAKRSCLRNAREKHWEMLESPLYAHALELADKSSAAFGVESRYPFFDRRLIELCLAMPANQKLGQGWSRFVLRRAMEGILPRDIQWRPAKGNLSPNFYRKLLEGDRELLDSFLLGDSNVLSPYIKHAAMREAYQNFSSRPLRSHDESTQVFSAVNLAVWLQNSGLAP